MGRVLEVVVVLFVLLSMFLTVLVQVKTSEYLDAQAISARAVDGRVFLCINTPPIVNISCPIFINQSTSIEDNTVYCDVYAFDLVDNISYYFIDAVVQTGLNVSIDHFGQITIWANQSGIGSYTVDVYAQDNSSCPLNGTAEYFFMILDINDPPHFSGALSNVQLSAGSSLRPFYLSNYFGDVDGDLLSYEVFGNTNLVITMTSSPSAQVIVTSPATNCGSELVYFKATDPGNLSAYSNVIQIDSLCSTESSPSVGGGGGSMGCEPEWVCKSWSRCFINGTKSRECYDKNGCNINNLVQTFWEACEYQPTCFDGIQNQGEEGIDCGGPCTACNLVPEEETIGPSCSDGIQNQGEEGIDCGGPCTACNLVLEEETIGPSCSDGIQNQGEEGIDCGGPCAPCRQIEVPALIPETDENNILSIAVITGLLLGVLAILYTIFRKEIKSIIAKIGWWLTGKKRKIILLDDNKREEFLDLIKSAEKKVISSESDLFEPTNPVLKEILRLNRYYLETILGISAESSPEQLELALIKKISNVYMRQALKLFIRKQSVSEKIIPVMTKRQVLLQVQELRQLVLNTSNYDKKDFDFLAVQMPADGKNTDKVFALLYNSMLALEFIEMESAKKNYLELLKMYELLDEQGKNLVYDEVTKLYYYTRYVLSWND